jgi:hypothetical protein
MAKHPTVRESASAEGSIGESIRIVFGGLALMVALVLVGPLLHLWCLVVMGWALLRAPLAPRPSG